MPRPPIRIAVLQFVHETVTFLRSDTTIDGHATNVPGVFVAGDARMGSRLTVTAIDDGRRCGRAVDRWLATR